MTEAKDNLNRLTLEVQRVRAKLYLDVKTHPVKYGQDKATEKSIEAVINTNDAVIELEQKIIEAKHRQGVCYERYDLAKFELAKTETGTGQNKETNNAAEHSRTSETND